MVVVKGDGAIDTFFFFLLRGLRMHLFYGCGGIFHCSSYMVSTCLKE